MSRYIKRYNALFLHIPKTGGVWVSEALTSLSIQHRQWRAEVSEKLPKLYGLLHHYSPDYKIDSVFTFVRRPIPYYESVWRDLSTKKTRRAYINKFTWHPFVEPASVWNSDFNVWISKMLEKYPAWLTRLVELYVGPKGGEFCTFIGRTENLVEDLTSYVVSLSEKFEDNEPHIRARLKQLTKVNVSDKSPRIKWDESIQGQLLAGEVAYLNRFYDESK